MKLFESLQMLVRYDKEAGDVSLVVSGSSADFYVCVVFSAYDCYSKQDTRFCHVHKLILIPTWVKWSTNRIGQQLLTAFFKIIKSERLIQSYPNIIMMVSNVTRAYRKRRKFSLSLRPKIFDIFSV